MIEKTFMDNEIYVARTHIKFLFPALMIQILLLAVHVLLWVYWPSNWFDEQTNFWVEVTLHVIVLLAEIYYVVIPILKWRNKKFIVTDRAIRSEWGVLYKHSREINLNRISSISEERGILDRIFGVGTLNFYDASSAAQPRTSGKWNKQDTNWGVQFRDVPDYRAVRELIENQQRNMSKSK